jgi:sialidase-1
MSAAFAAVLAVTSSVVLSSPAHAAASATPGVVLFDPAKDKLFGSVTYNDFRIPSIVATTPSGGGMSTLVAFAEGRVDGSDWGNIDLVYKTSTDNGNTWSGIKSVLSGPWGGGTAENSSYGNPTPVYDPSTRKLWVWHMRTNASKTSIGSLEKGDRVLALAYTTVNADGTPGAWTFSHASLAGLQATQPNEGGNWWDNVGPGNGIYMRDGTMVVPGRNRNIVSTDHGTTWTSVPLNGTSAHTDESTVTERTNTDGKGTLYRDDRATTTYWNGKRLHSFGSENGGFSGFTASSVSDPSNGPGITPGCQGSTFRYNFAKSGGNDWQRMLFLNPSDPVQRHNMKIRVSYDNGVTWTAGRLLEEAGHPSGWGTGYAEGGYSSMARTDEPQVGVLTEAWRPSSTWFIIFRKLNLAWITQGTTEPTPPPQ